MLSGRKKGRGTLIMLLIMVALIIITGCAAKAPSDISSGETESGGSPQSSGEQTAGGSTELAQVYPLQKDVKLTYWVGVNASVALSYTNYGDMPFFKELMKKTGVTIEFMHPVQGQESESLNILLASGELPDLIEYNWYGFMGGPEKAISDGYIRSLNDIIKQYSPNLYKYLSENPIVDKMVKTDNGNYYVYPFIRGDDALVVFVGPIVRKDWLDDLGLPLPETMDDWYQMLTAFKENKGAAAPLTYEEGLLSQGAFSGAYGVIRDFYVEDGVVKYGPMEPGWRDFLAVYSKWYQEGLIDPDIAVVDRNTVGAKMTGGQAGASMGFAGSRLGSWMQSMADVDPRYELAGAPYPVINKGEKPKFGHMDYYYGLSGSVAITTKCRDVESAARLLDYGYSEEGHMLYNFGVESVSYNIVDGYPKYTDFIMNNPDGLPINQILAGYARGIDSGPFIQDVRYHEQYISMPQQRQAITAWKNTDAVKYKLPPVTATPEESQEASIIMNEVNTYMQEMFFKFLMGVEPLDKFDEYVSTLKELGIERVIEIKQEGIERYNNR
ncbi:MAG TPA: ABC transporter substrate-binding protein [Clostridia bacterium]